LGDQASTWSRYPAKTIPLRSGTGGRKWPNGWLTFGPAEYHRHRSCPAHPLHYRKSIAFPKGGNYKNTERHWDDLRWAVRDARYLGLIPDDDFEDRRNAVPIVNLTNGARSADVGIPQRSRRFAYAEAGQPRLYGGCGREFWIASADDVLCPRCGRRQTRRKAHNGPHSHHPRSSTPPSADRLEWSGQGCAAP